ncbi:leucine-rich repeat domain-containing protein [Amygdalobacter indicium]|uniref:leucine-rich repeat domain-containing protein n=1 Tax=Amygdalobacter indicium TaxID=3029272 RepID=UPI00279C9956|nr:leucine-rich repeat domain-containing protein [Amygdalobacter indicium]WEG34492.1 leucine-rich repeat domain-containing protein [Amygdalobacter indicium]
MKWSKNSNLFLSLLLSVSMCAISVGVGMGATPVVSEASGQVTPPAAQTVIQFKDQKLKASLLQYMKDRHIIKADAQDITPAEAEKLGPVPGDVTNTYRLTFGSHEIKDLTGMQYFKNLTELELDQNQIEDIQPLAALTKLTVLNLAQNKISDITPLAQMKNLKDLQLNDNQIKDITPLQNLTELTDLSLARNGVTDITPLAGLTKLTKLDLSSNKISDIKPLAALTDITDLNLAQNKFSDITPLAALTDITNLNLGTNQITQIDTLKNLTKLNTLSVSGNNVSDITPLANLVTLSTLNVGSNKISDVAALKGLSNLTELDASSNNIEKLDALKGLKKLAKLDVYTNCIRDISPVKELKNLTEFYVYDQTIKLKSNTKETPLALKYADKLKFTVQDANKSDGEVKNAKFILNKFPHTGDVKIDFSSDDDIDGISITDLYGGIFDDKMCYTGTITISYDAQNPDPQPPQPPVQNQKTVTFNKKDGSALTTVKVETGKKIVAASMPAAPAEEGLTFKEWNTQQDGQGKAFTADTVVSEDLTVYAIYTKNPVTPPQPPVQNQKTVKFNKKDGSVLTTVKVEAGKKIAATAMPAAPTEEGLTFKEWNTQQDGQGKAFTVDTVVSEDLTVYAIYTKKTVPVPQPPTPPQPQPSQSKGQVTVDPTTPAGSTVNEQPSIRPHKVAKTGEAANAVTYVSLLAYAFVGLEILRSRK